MRGEVLTLSPLYKSEASTRLDEEDGTCLDTTNRYAEVNIARKTKALAALDPGTQSYSRKKPWREKGVMEFLRSL
jgi:hypothetical protein